MRKGPEAGVGRGVREKRRAESEKNQNILYSSIKLSKNKANQFFFKSLQLSYKIMALFTLIFIMPRRSYYKIKSSIWVRWILDEVTDIKLIFKLTERGITFSHKITLGCFTLCSPLFSEPADIFFCTDCVLCDPQFGAGIFKTIHGRHLAEFICIWTICIFEAEFASSLQDCEDSKRTEGS